MDPNLHIIDIPQNQSFRCNICYGFSTRLVKCSGQCAKTYCIQCVSQWITKNDSCPSRCSKPFKVVQIPGIKFQFNCPFNQQKCQAKIKSLSEFHEHYKFCQVIQKNQIEQLKKRYRFKCKNNHRLQFNQHMIGYQNIKAQQIEKEKQCAQCGKNNQQGRAYCRVCRQRYCFYCRPIPCSIKGCPLNHKFQPCSQKKQIKQNQNKLLANFFNHNKKFCIECGLNLNLTSNNYEDLQCGISICGICYNHLPIRPMSIINSIINKYEECQEGHNLSYVKMIKTQKTNECFLCKRERICAKYCKNCQQYYCLSCKPAEIDIQRQCKFGHKIQLSYNPVYENQLIRKQTGRLCMVCHIDNVFLYVDKGCGFLICSKCMNQMFLIKNLSRPPIQSLKCKKGHQLLYYLQIMPDPQGNPLVLRGICNDCQNYNFLLLHCIVCRQVENYNYCFGCKQIQYKTCYYGHLLEQFRVTQQCLKCMGQHKKMVSCKQCFFQICTDCQRYSIELEQQKKQIKK